MEKIKAFIKAHSGNSPITWGQYWKMYGVVVIFYVLIHLVLVIYFKLEPVVSGWIAGRKAKDDPKE